MSTTFMAIAPHYWGKGPTPDAAKSNLRHEQGHLGKYILLLMPPGSTEHYVDFMGGIGWTWEDGADRTGVPIEVARRGIKKEDVA